MTATSVKVKVRMFGLCKLDMFALCDPGRCLLEYKNMLMKKQLDEEVSDGILLNVVGDSYVNDLLKSMRQHFNIEGTHLNFYCNSK